MNKKYGLILILSIIFLSGIMTYQSNADSVNEILLGEASHFAILAGAHITTVPASIIIGDIGVSPADEDYITGFSQTSSTGFSTSTQVLGKIYAADMVVPVPAMLTQAKNDLKKAYDKAAGITPAPKDAFLNPGDGNLAGLNIFPGVYKFTRQAIATRDFTIVGRPDDVWIFQINSALIISNGVHITLTGGAQAKNIFWQVGTSATLGTTVDFYGNILADQSISIKTGAILHGRALAFTGSVTLDHSAITIPLK